MSGSLNVLVGHLEGELSAVDSFFEGYYTLDWLKDEIIIEMLKDICGYTGHVGYAVTVKSVFNENETVTIPITGLPSGVKALLILWNTDEKFVSVTRCGDNCAKWISEFSKYKHLFVTVNHLLPLDNFPIHILNDGSVVNSLEEWYLKCSEFLGTFYDESCVSIS